MGTAISEEHRELARTTRSLLTSHDVRGAARSLLDGGGEGLPGYWKEFADLGLLGVHLPAEFGGGGAGLPELAVIVEETGRAVAPGPVLPTVVASALIAARGAPATRAALLPGLAAGTAIGALGLGGDLAADGPPGPDGEVRVSGRSGVVLGGHLATLVLLAVGDDIVMLVPTAPGVTVQAPASLDPTRRSVRLLLTGVRVEPGDRLVGARPYAEAVLRSLVAAEAIGGAQGCVEAATAHAKVREQFGRTIGTFQAVKHHAANMLVAAELATAAGWDAARAADGPASEFELAAAVAAALAVPAYVANAELDIHLHGGIGYTWEHEAHLHYRRAVTLRAVVEPSAAARDVTRLRGAGVLRAAAFDLPAEAEAARPEVRAFAEQLVALPEDERRRQLVDSGYLQPHWPRPWGLGAAPGLQLVIEQEFRAAEIRVPNLLITGWVMLTVVQHGSPEQVARWVRPALLGTEMWCQLFSEPDAGSDAAAVRTRAERVDGGWLVNGQKVWTTDAHRCRYGLATVRTDPAAGKHAGITTMVLDLRADGVEVRPLRTITGDYHFNEVFFTDVFVPDDDVVGDPGRGWAVARTVLGNERVSLGRDLGGGAGDQLLALLRQHGDRIPGAESRLGTHLAQESALRLLNLRWVARALDGSGPGPEGNVTKLATAEHGQRTAALVVEFAGPDVAFDEGLGGPAGRSLLGTRALTIAGGTSEISRNQIAERILGLPRDPLLS
ncbi:acyl-CoA dehydrogenase [Frankia sp. AgB32]|uniref:acyl-CoA dehydrogenase n=1 Tax=Frankia sp. AgB32 TaxID=631119 RepID=UPI00200FB172|nr:acyl-CoA dehydrogenase [Frankia sp. AgB32]MCK9896171.1 acyl-CoA dehydrogenase [Frankia sp. AgB32]